MNPVIQCPACRASLMDGVFNRPDFSPCPACGVPLQVTVFPAMFRRVTTGQNAETILVEGESSCFYHPQKKAVLPCDGCGRFLCALCDCPLDSGHFCPACLEAGRTRGKIRSLDQQRILFDSIALGLVIYPVITVFFFYLTIISAPVALFLSIRYWNAPMGIVRRTKARFVAAAAIATLEILGWIALVIALIFHNA
jgi:hypothetical protein